jgi:SAM-dependent methyltransferase
VAQVKQTDTPELKRWFGDSKVVDASGDPMVVYHGTSKDKPFSSFTRNAQGTWFTSDPEAASSYATTNDSQKVVYEDGRYVSKNTSAQVFPVYLSIKNPLKVEGEVLEKWRKSVNYRAANKMLVGDAKYRGYDGLMFGEGVFVAFEPTQIKSAIGNKGTFDPKDSNITNPRQLMGININDSTQDFTGQILRGEKTIETRSTRSLDPYIGNRVGIIRTGVGKATLVGYATVGEPVFYDSVAKFRRDQSKHLVAPGSAFDIKDRLRYGYPLMQVEPITPKLVQSKGIVARKLNPKDPRSAMTQITGTEDTYIKASKMLSGKVIDYGAGRGIGTDALRSNGLLADSFEPFPENWEGKRPPTYTDSANIPSSAYDSLVSFSVINVVDPDERKFLFKEVARILRPDGVALITGRDRQDVQKSTTKIPHLEEGGYLIGKGKQQRYQKGFTQAELERYAKEVLGPDFTVEKNGMLNGASIKITKGKTNPTKRNAIRNKLSRIIESDDRILCYDTAADEDFYRLWDIIHTDLMLNKESLREIEGMLDDDGVLVIESGETPAGLQDHFRKATRYQGLLLVQGPLNPEQSRIETDKLRRDLE